MSRLGIAGVAVLCGVLGACPYLAPLTGSPGSAILVSLTQLPLFVAGLWLGLGASALAGLAASLTIWATGGIMAAALFAALNAIPVLLLVRQALLARTGSQGVVEWYPPGLLTAWLAGLGLAGIAAALLLLGGADGLRVALREVSATALAPFVGENTSDRGELADILALILPGIVASSWMAMAVTNGSLAQGLLARCGVNWRPSPDLATLALPIWIPMLLAFAAAATIFEGTPRFLGINVMIVLTVPFCLAGLAVIHTIARRFHRPAIPLVSFYVLAGVFGWPLLLVALLGVLDASVGLRRRLPQPLAVGNNQ